MDDRPAPAPAAEISPFADLKDFAMRELERARSDLASAPDPSLSVFEIDIGHFVQGEACNTLRREIAAAIPVGAVTIYYIRPRLVGGETLARIQTRFVESRRGKDGRSRVNGRQSDILYVGSSRKMSVRMREHLGFCSPSTYALKLSDWYPPEDLPLQLFCAIYPPGISATLIGAPEDALWERLQPMFGRKGAR